MLQYTSSEDMKEVFRKNTGIISFAILLFILGITMTILYTNNNSTTTRRFASASVPTRPPSHFPNTPANSPSPTFVIHQPIYLGMWTEGFWNDTTFRLQPEKLINLENSIGKKMAIAHYYRGWENLYKPSIIEELRAIDSQGWRPMLSTNPFFFDKCPSQNMPLYKAIASGNCDNFLREAALNLKTFGKPLLLRYAWEMNIDSIEWGVGKTGSSPQDFINAWRRFHDIAKSQEASNIIWVFSPNVETSSSIPYSQLYPGDSYVDWLGLDGYNWGTSKSWTYWQSFTLVFNNSYKNLTQLSPFKPLMIAEVNTTDQGGDKANWYRKMLTEEIPNNFPQIKAVIFYNENRNAQEQVNWLINNTPETLSAFSESIKNPIYISSF